MFGGKIMDFFKKYTKKYWKSFFTAVVFLTFEAVCDLLQPTIMSKIVDIGVAERRMDYVIKGGLIMLAVTLLGAVAAVSRNIISSNVSQKFGAELRGDLFKKIHSFSFSSIDKFETASLVTRLTNDVTQVQNFVHGMMRIFVKAPLLCIGSIIMAVIINPRMSVVLFLIVPFIVVIIFANMKIGYPFFRKVQKALDKLNSVIREYLSGVRVVKAFNRFQYERKRFEITNEEFTDVSTSAMRVMAIFMPMITFIVNVGIVAVLWFGGIKVNRGNMYVGQIIAFTNYMTQILFSLMMISFVFVMFVRAKASAERIEEIFKEKNLNEELHDVELKNFQGNIEFKHVCFSYNDKLKEPVLDNITFKCMSGETVGIIGSTGAGKSTLINLLDAFYEATSGEITIDEVDIRKLNIKKLRERIGIVPQSTMLFSGTIIDNISWGKEDASIQEVEKAAVVAQAHEFISSFPKKYNTVLGQGGVNLSGGQKQRIAIARALIKKPRILILDDCTSAVDMNTEKKIKEALREYSKELTCIIIAQRITSVMGADKIIVMDNGKIVGIGKHKELMENCNVYKEILRCQAPPEKCRNNGEE